MTRTQLEHAIRAACGVLGTDKVYVVGSQSILASYPGLSGCVAKSNEADIVPRLREGEQDGPTPRRWRSRARSGQIPSSSRPTGSWSRAWWKRISAFLPAGRPG